MISFLLNDTLIRTTLSAGTTLLDFIRYHQYLKGTKCGCREGDCGACTVLAGSLSETGVHYLTITSCLTPLSNIAGKHIVTVEGINTSDGGLTPVQSAIADESGTQCGFCTPGFVMSLTGYCLKKRADGENGDAVAAIDGNICRCTGYKSLERAAKHITHLANQSNESPLDYAIEKNIVPSYFSDIEERLKKLQAEEKPWNEEHTGASVWIGGGTDLYVHSPEKMADHPGKLLPATDQYKGIFQEGDQVFIGANTTVTEWLESPLMQSIFPDQRHFIQLISSTPIRNIATVGGNLVNASPIGDLAIWLLAMNAVLTLRRSDKTSSLIPLKDFYLSYKKTALQAGDLLEKIQFTRPQGAYFFNFEKVSKRTYLDIASVNSAICLHLEGDIILQARITAGGIAPIPLYLKQTSAFFAGKSVAPFEVLLREATPILLQEISPISDVRGSADYKKRLAVQLLRAHFLKILLQA